MLFAPVVFGKGRRALCEIVPFELGSRGLDLAKGTPKRMSTRTDDEKPRRNLAELNGGCFFMKEIKPTQLENGWAIESPDEVRALANSHASA